MDSQYSLDTRSHTNDSKNSSSGQLIWTLSVTVVLLALGVYHYLQPHPLLQREKRLPLASTQNTVLPSEPPSRSPSTESEATSAD